MPNREFLETYPLYRKFKMDIPDKFSELEIPPVNMNCTVCNSEQTFNTASNYKQSTAIRGKIKQIVYICASCREFRRHFLIKFSQKGDYVMKVGQEPPWEITPDKELERILGPHAEYYKKGLICESQGYGICAFAYYRRIVEDIIDELLSDIQDLLVDEEQARYIEALEKVKQTTVTQEKIDLVKDLLPPILRPDGMNPLSVLHSTLSEGLHQKSDERCIELAMRIREVLNFLVNQITATQEASKSFTKSMRRLLDRKA